jgi:hypothetical protein
MNMVSAKDPLSLFLKRASVEGLTKRVPRLLSRLTGGRCGGYELSSRRVARACDTAIRVGAEDAFALDTYTTETCGPSIAAIAHFSEVFRKELASRAAPTIGRMEARALQARAELGTKALFTAALLMGSVLVVETLLGQPLASRLGPGGEFVSYLVSACLGVMLMLAAHTAVHDTPPGRRQVVRMRLRVGALGSLAAFLLAAAYLRKFPGTGTGDYATPSATGAETRRLSFSSHLGPASMYLAMVMFMVLTFCVAALIALRYEQQLSQVDPDGPRSRAADRHIRCFYASLEQLTNAADELGIQFNAAYLKGIRSAVSPDVADRLVLPDRSSRASQLAPSSERLPELPVTPPQS